MKNFITRALVLGATLFAVSGCISAKSYVDPTYAKATYNDIRRVADPQKWKIIVEFRRQGEPYPRVDSTLLQQVVQVVRGTGIASPTTLDEPSVATFSVMVNNFSDTGAAVAKGFGTGLTFGLVGTMVTDYYEMTITLTKNGNTVTKSGYKGALNTTIGNASGPPGLEGLPTATAFDKVVEQMLLNALSDLQKDVNPASSRLEFRLEPRRVFAVRGDYTIGGFSHSGGTYQFN